MPFPFQYRVIATPTATTHVTPSLLLLLLPLLMCVVFAANTASATISSTTTTSATPSITSPEKETQEQHALNMDTPPSISSSLATSLFSKEEPYVFRWIKSLLEDVNSKIGENDWTKYVVNSLTPTPKMKRLLAAVGYMLVDMLPVAFILWYSRLLLGSPEVDGSQFRENIVNFLKRNVFPSYEAFFHLNIALDTGKSSNKNDCPSTPASPFTEPPAINNEQQHQEKEEDLTVQPDTQYFFAYHPHGILPNTIAWLHHSTTWERIVKIRGSSIVSFGASIIFNTPFLRDLALTCGSREVSKHAIETAIRQGKSPLLVPGGQSEMIHSWPSKNVLHIVTYHHGFVRLAMKHRIPLVPIMCYGEHNVYYNVYLPKLQYWFLKRVGFGFPVLPIGWRFLPLPGRCPLNVVVGVPMNTEKIGERTLDFNNPDDVAECAELYFTHLSELFYRHRVVSGYPDMQLVYHGDKRNPMKGTPQPPPPSSLEKEEDDDPTLLFLRKKKERKAESTITSKRNSQTTKEVSSATNSKKNKSKKK